jgi:hypothetical protein
MSAGTSRLFTNSSNSAACSTESSTQETLPYKIEADSLAVQLPFQDRDLMAKGQDLRVLVPLVHRQQAQGPNMFDMLR